LGLALFLSLPAGEIVFVGSSTAMAAAALPRLSVDTSFAQPGGSVIQVLNGGDLQAAFNAAVPGDVIELQAGAVFTGNFLLPAKNGNGWIYVQTSALGSLPPPGARVGPGNAGAMAKIVTPNSSPAIQTASGAHHYRFVGIELSTTPGNATIAVFSIGSGETSAGSLPHDITIDRCYVHGDAAAGSRRGIAMNGNSIAVIDSYVSDFKDRNTDSQALWSANGAGPFRIQGNYLEGSGENVMFGGADPSISGLVPSDIEITANNFFKPEAWRSQGWSVKNLLELKNARRVLIDGNILEQNWAGAQTGFAVLFTPRNQSGGAPWSTVEDVTFSNNAVRSAGAGVNILGTDDEHSSQRARGIVIRNNLFTDISGERWGGNGVFLQVLSGPSDVVVEHVTVEQTGGIIVADGSPSSGFVFRDNIAFHNDFGVFGSGEGVGNRALEHYFPGAVFTNNVMIGPYPTAGGADPSMYSNFPGNFFPNSVSEVGFANASGGDFRLGAGSPYKGAATDGGDIGAQLGGTAVAAEMRASLGAEALVATNASESSGGGCSLDRSGASPEWTSLAFTLAIVVFLAGRERRRRTIALRCRAEGVEPVKLEANGDSHSTDSPRPSAGVAGGELERRG
jgi:hypothetical protein